jgi:hypothetical protein
MRTSSMNAIPIDGCLREPRQQAGLVATSAVVLMLLAEGQGLVRMSRAAGWPARQIRVLANRNGYLFTVDGTPYKPPTQGEKPRTRRRAAGAAP